MVKKSELIEVLEKAISLEEKSIPIYLQHLESAVFWLGMDEDKTEKIKAIFRNLADGSKRHYAVVSSLLERVKAEKRDAF